jgi:hypothetical protein
VSLQADDEVVSPAAGGTESPAGAIPGEPAERDEGWLYLALLVDVFIGLLGG